MEPEKKITIVSVSREKIGTIIEQLKNNQKNKSFSRKSRKMMVSAIKQLENILNSKPGKISINSAQLEFCQRISNRQPNSISYSHRNRNHDFTRRSTGYLWW